MRAVLWKRCWEDQGGTDARAEYSQGLVGRFDPRPNQAELSAQTERERDTHTHTHTHARTHTDKRYLKAVVAGEARQGGKLHDHGARACRARGVVCTHASVCNTAAEIHAGIRETRGRIKGSEQPLPNVHGEVEQAVPVLHAADRVVEGRTRSE